MCFVVAWPEWLFLFSQGMLQGKTTIWQVMALKLPYNWKISAKNWQFECMIQEPLK